MTIHVRRARARNSCEIVLLFNARVNRPLLCVQATMKHTTTFSRSPAAGSKMTLVATTTTITTTCSYFNGMSVVACTCGHQDWARLRVL